MQGGFGDFRITGNALAGTLAPGQGPRAFFLFNGDATRECVCEFTLPETPERVAAPVTGHVRHLDLSPLHNSDHLVVPVRARVAAIQLLCAATLKVRLTGMRLGQVRLRYADGFTSGEPLVYGRNMDNSGMPFATETERVSAGGGGWLFAFTVRCDPERVLEAFIIEIVATDVQLGLVAANGVESGGSGPILDEG